MKEFTGYKRGVNLGGWLSQTEHTTEHYNTFITENDIRIISGWGMDHVRLPIDYELVKDNDGNDIEEGYTYIDNCLEWCKKYNLNMILDLHKTAGYSFDEDANSFFYSPDLQVKFIELWDALAQRYGKYHERLVFELLNEVVDDKVEDTWNGIIKKTIPVIRKYAPTIRIIVGGVRNNSVLCVRGLDKPYDENIVYTFHFYEPLIFTHQKAYWVKKMTEDFETDYPCDLDTYIEQTEKYLPAENGEFYDTIRTKNADKEFIRTSFADALKTAEERNVPIYCGEYGVIDRTSVESALNWFSDMHSVFEEYSISRAVWNYKGKDFGIIDGHYSGVLDKLIKLL
ncbi:MAG: cellulase family glycosylhydrolase [Oscillospiraceae bacterium]|nr:cellulase family glycosylhydrolase [Oscillospiraceae bacterium]